MSVRVFIGSDGTITLVRADGSRELLLPGGHPRPGCSHATSPRLA